MNVACIKDNLCDNIVVADTIETVSGMLGDKYDLYVCGDNGAMIGFEYIDGKWVVPSELSEGEVFCPSCNTNLADTVEVCPVCRFDLGSLL